MNLETNLYTISEIIGAGITHFEIKSYQRGYRWEISDVEILIKDILDSNDGKVYCMQPLVVSELSDNRYEVIDGQQRLTTFKILLHCLGQLIDVTDIPSYVIEYETRSCASFLEKLYANAFKSEVDEFHELNKLKISDLWNSLTLGQEELNRDNFHLFQSYCTCTFILSSLKEHNTEERKLHSLKDKLQKQVKFIWYEVDLNTLNTSAEKLFININQNKIRLTGADLIKALYILDIENQKAINVEVKNLKKQTLATEWDEIEQALRNPDFWFFITNTKDLHYDVRIGKLFDIVTENTQESDLGAYFAMKANLQEWSELYKLFRISQEWYEEIFLYHRIGFIVNMNIKSFNEILKKYPDTHSKKSFKEWIESLISNYIKSVALIDLDYEKPKHKGRYGHCTGVLLLYNILLLEKYYPRQRFSFGDFVEQEWSLEHIQPRNPKIKTAAAWLAWLKEIEPVLTDKSAITIIKENSTEEIDLNLLKRELYEIEKVENLPKVTGNILNTLQDVFEKEYPINKIQNLTLLDKTTNSKLSNGLFKEKREWILQIQDIISEDKVFLPLGTINIFTKAMILKKEDIQLEYWSINDGESYLKEISSLLKPYLNE